MGAEVLGLISNKIDMIEMREGGNRAYTTINNISAPESCHFCKESLLVLPIMRSNNDMINDR